MFVKPKDSRQRYTKECLFKSFLFFLDQKPVSEITVSEICEDAGVSRKTFYKYYSDQFALLMAMQEDLFAEFEARLEYVPANVFEMVPVIIAFAADHRVLVRAVFENRSEGNFIDRILDYLYGEFHGEWEAQNPGMSERDVKFLFYFVTSGLAGVIKMWLFDEPEMTVEEVAHIAESLMKLSS